MEIGRITFSKIHSNLGETYVLLTLRDWETYKEIFCIKMSLTDFSLALLGQGFTPCAYEEIKRGEGVIDDHSNG